ncbi:MAG: glycosyltransferase [Erysipelotrichaceae bacterium]|nr:glycosyltransferase [Erysipelotrichaceae bacterium]
MACGTPVITYNTGGSIEVINEKTGLVTETNDRQGLLKAIKELKIRHVPEDEALKYSDENMCRAYLELYDAVSGGKNE